MDETLQQALLLGREHYRQGDDDRAEYFLRKVADREHRYADVFDQLGVIAYRQGHYDRAAACFRRALELNENYTDARVHLAVTYNELGRYEEARRLGSALKGGHPWELDAAQRGRIANLHACTARAYEEAERFDAAIGELEKAVELCPTFVDLRLGLARLWRLSGRFERAEHTYRRLLDDKPDYAEAALQLSALLLDTGRPQNALELLTHLEQVAPGNVRARLYQRRARQALGLGQAG